MTCNKHPKYKGIRRPMARCVPCWSIYQEQHGILVAKKKYRDFIDKITPDIEESVFQHYWISLYADIRFFEKSCGESGKE